MKAKINTNLFPIISVGMYESVIDHRYVWQDGFIQNDFEEGHIEFNENFFFDKFDGKKYDKKVEEIAQEFIEEIHMYMNFDLDEFLPIKMKAGDLYSPSYYNFATDQIELTVKFSKKEALKRIHAQFDEFCDFLKENYTSYDGFHSWTPNNYGDWLVRFKEKNVQAIGAALSFLFRDAVQDTRNGFHEYVIEKIRESCYDEFLEDGAIEKWNEQIEVVKKFTRENYGRMNVKEMVSLVENQYDYEIENLDEEVILKTIRETINEINEHTIKLKL